MIFYEAARRLGETLTEMAEVFGGDRAATVVREITKTYEETIRGSLSDLAARFGREQALGEIVIIVEGLSEKDSAASSSAVALKVEDLTRGRTELETGERAHREADRCEPPRGLSGSAEASSRNGLEAQADWLVIDEKLARVRLKSSRRND